MGMVKRGSAGLSARIGWERNAADWQMIPAKRRLFHTQRLAPTRIPVLLLWLFAVLIAIGVGRILLHQFW